MFLLLCSLLLGPVQAGYPKGGPAFLIEEAESGEAEEVADYLSWAAGLERQEHPEPAYHFLADAHGDIAARVADRPGVVTPFIIGHTVRKQPIWAFRVRSPGSETQKKVLIFGGIHALEWISVEVTTSFLCSLIERPVQGVEVVVIPALNVDGHHIVEADLLAGRNTYRRGNAAGVDLNRDFAINREPRAIWRHIIPAYYQTSAEPLSQPESRALDALAAAERFDVAVSLHAFGGFIYHPWAGLWERAPDWAEFVALGKVMAGGQGAHAYRVRQLSHWAFFFRGHGMEVDHLYGRYGTRSFLVELTRSGLEPFDPSTWKNNFRLYNPRDPQRHVVAGTGALRALVGHLEGRLEPPLVSDEIHPPPGD